MKLSNFRVIGMTSGSSILGRLERVERSRSSLGGTVYSSIGPSEDVSAYVSPFVLWLRKSNSSPDEAKEGE